MTATKHTRMPYGAYYKTDVPSHDPELTHTDRGTPMGEYMRRFWQPVCMSERARRASPRRFAFSGKTSSPFAIARDVLAYCNAIAVIAAPRSSSASSSPGVFAAACTAGSTTSTGPYSRHPSSRKQAGSRRRCAMAPTRPSSVMAWSSPTWAPPRTNRCFRNLTPIAALPTTSSWQSPRSIPATGCRCTRTSLTISTSRCCTIRSS